MTEQEQPTLPQVDTGLACLVMLARFHGVAADADQLAHQLRECGGFFGVTEILLGAKHLGLKAKPVQAELQRLDTTPLPALASARDGTFFIVGRVEEGQVFNHDP